VLASAPVKDETDHFLGLLGSVGTGPEGHRLRRGMAEFVLRQQVADGRLLASVGVRPKGACGNWLRGKDGKSALGPGPLGGHMYFVYQMKM
jgi:hypothetical protein